MSDIKSTASFVFLYVLAIGFAVVVGLQLLHGIAPSEIAVGFVTTIMGYAINEQGNSHGVANTNDTVAKTAAALPAAVSILSPGDNSESGSGVQKNQ